MPLESCQMEKKGITYTYTPVEQKAQADFSSPVPYVMTSERGRERVLLADGTFSAGQ